jgi:hypothetical protein
MVYLNSAMTSALSEMQGEAAELGRSMETLTSEYASRTAQLANNPTISISSVAGNYHHTL